MTSHVDAFAPEDDFSQARTHHVAMAVVAMMNSITELCEMAGDGIGYDLIHNDIDDLELSYARLGHLLHALRSQRREAAE